MAPTTCCRGALTETSVKAQEATGACRISGGFLWLRFAPPPGQQVVRATSGYGHHPLISSKASLAYATSPRPQANSNDARELDLAALVLGDLEGQGQTFSAERDDSLPLADPMAVALA